MGLVAVSQEYGVALQHPEHNFKHADIKAKKACMQITKISKFKYYRIQDEMFRSLVAPGASGFTFIVCFFILDACWMIHG